MRSWMKFIDQMDIIWGWNVEWCKAHPPNFKKDLYVLLSNFLDWQFFQPI